MQKCLTVWGLALLLVGGSATLIQTPSASATDAPLQFEDVSVDANSTTNTTTIIRCRAQEVSQGQALWTILVLGISSVVHRSGSLTLLAHQGFYRLAPELGILEALELLSLIFQGVFDHKEGFWRSLKASLALRHCLGYGQSWWLDNDWWVPYSAEWETLADREFREEYLDYLDDVLGEVQNYSHARLIGIILTTIAFVKACVISGSIRTTALAASLFLPFAIIESLSWLCLRVNAKSASLESKDESRQVVVLMALLDPFRGHENTVSAELAAMPAHQRYSQVIRKYGTCFQSSVLFGKSNDATVPTLLTLMALRCLAGLLCLQSAIWPICVPWFLIMDFHVVQTGHWIFTILTAIIWLSYIMAPVVLVTVVLFAWSKVRRADVEWIMSAVITKCNENGWKYHSFTVATYVGLKVALICRLYLTDYTGQDTRKPDWLDWLG